MVEPHIINKKFIFANLIFILSSIGYDAICWFLYFNMTSKHSVIIKLFLAYCIIITVQHVNDIYTIFLMIKCYGTTISINVWNLLQLGNFLGMLNPLNLINHSRNFVCLWIFFTNDNLSKYNNNRTISFINYCICAIAISSIMVYTFLTAMMILGHKICSFNRNECMKNYKLHNIILYNRDMYRLLPTSSIEDITCSICLESNEEINNENNNEQIWTELDCGHKFHIKCITEWSKYSDMCPYCRQTHSYDNIDNYQIV